MTTAAAEIAETLAAGVEAAFCVPGESYLRALPIVGDGMFMTDHPRHIRGHLRGGTRPRGERLVHAKVNPDQLSVQDDD